MKYETFESDCYNLYTIKTNKFKSCHAEIVFRSKCSIEEITASALLFDVLLDSTKEYNKRKDLIKKEQNLYNLNLYSVNSRVGNMMITSLALDFLDPKYMDDSTLEEIFKLVFSVIFNPNVEDNEFNEEVFNRSKKKLLSEIEAVREDAKQQSILSALKSLSKTEPFSFSASGDANILKDITPKKLYEFYKNFLENNMVDIYIIGNLDMKEVNKLIKKYSLFKSIKTNKIELYLNETSAKKCKTIKSDADYGQMSMVNIYTLKNLDNYERDYVIPLFNLIWGSNSLDSKLYKTLRQDNALCYSVQTFYQKYDRLIILYTGIDKENADKTHSLINKTLNDMFKGYIEKKDLENAKNMVLNSLNLIYDSPNRLVDNYLFSNIASLPSIDERIDEFKKVNIDDLVKLSKKIHLAVDYRIGG